MRRLMPVFMPARTIIGSIFKNFRIPFSVEYITFGTTEETTTAFTSPTETSEYSNSERIISPVSSEVRPLCVESRQLALSIFPSNTPNTIFVLLTSITSIIAIFSLRRPHPRPAA